MAQSQSGFNGNNQDLELRAVLGDTNITPVVPAGNPAGSATWPLLTFTSSTFACLLCVLVSWAKACASVRLKQDLHDELCRQGVN